MFDTIPQPKISAYNALIIAFSRHILPTQVLDSYRRLVADGVARRDSSMFTIVLKACAQLSDLKSSEEIQNLAFELGYGCDVFVCSSLIYLYAKCWRMEDGGCSGGV